MPAMASCGRYEARYCGSYCAGGRNASHLAVPPPSMLLLMSAPAYKVSGQSSARTWFLLVLKLALISKYRFRIFFFDAPHQFPGQFSCSVLKVRERSKLSIRSSHLPSDLFPSNSATSNLVPRVPHRSNVSHLTKALVLFAESLRGR